MYPNCVKNVIECLKDLPGIGEKTAERLRKEYNADIITVVANVANRAEMDAAAAKAVEAFGELNIACCNAGVCRLAPFEEMTDEMRDFHIDVNIKGVWNTCKAVVPYMLKQGKGAIVIPTGFITAKSGIEKKILQKIVDDKIVYGCVSMPSNVFANTGTNVSVLFFDKSASADKVILIDASKLGEEYKDANGLKKVRLSNDEIERIVTTFLNKEAVDDFSVAVTCDEIKEKGYSLSAGQYFDIKIDYVDITEEEFNKRMTDYKQTLTQQFEESHRLEVEIMKQLDSLKFNN